MTNDWQHSVSSAAGHLFSAENERRNIDPLTDSWAALDVASAYAIQAQTLEWRQQRGERLVGLKLGLTSVAKQQRMGIDAPLTAWLTDAMVLPLGQPVPLDRLIAPRAEPEIVFLMGKRLEGPGVHAAQALAAVEAVYAGVEIIDSRFRDFRFTLPDVIADNASTGRFVLGPVQRPPASLDLSLEACLVEVDGAVVDSATGAAVQGHPAEALALAANALAARGQAVEAGWLVLTGGMTDAVPVPQARSIRFPFTNLGSLSISGAQET